MTRQLKAARRSAFNLSLSAASKARIQKLFVSTEAATASEVVRRALQAYESAAEYMRAGHEILVRHPSEQGVSSCQLLYRTNLAGGSVDTRLATLGSKALKGRLNLTFSEVSRERIERLKTLTEAETASEVVRRALQVFESLMDYLYTGHEILVRSSQDKELRPFEFTYHPQLSDARGRGEMQAGPF